MKAQTFKRIIKDSINNWSGDVKEIDFKKNGFTNNDELYIILNDGSEFKILVETIKESEDTEGNYYQD